MDLATMISQLGSTGALGGSMGALGGAGGMPPMGLVQALMQANAGPKNAMATGAVPGATAPMPQPAVQQAVPQMGAGQGQPTWQRPMPQQGAVPQMPSMGIQQIPDMGDGQQNPMMRGGRPTPSDMMQQRQRLRSMGNMSNLGGSKFLNPFGLGQ